MTESEVKDISKVTVKIYGQDYTFSSAVPRDRIVAIANHVDEVIKGLVEQGADGSVARLTMLAAINITEELFEERETKAESERDKEQLRKDIVHFQQLWEEAKRSHLQYKDDAKAIQEQKDAIQEKLNAKSVEADNLIRGAEEREEAIRQLEAELGAANEKLSNMNNQSEEGGEMIRELKARLKEIEGNYFELQMENIQMKGDLEHYRMRP
ncbi:MAG: cell division protein ZapA [Clostridiales bacterium]|nr:cell division protein ZapA [Clostridiales bacterium]